MVVDFSSILLRHDQPTTCPICGARTDILVEFINALNEPEIHVCLDLVCRFAFLVESDEDFERETLYLLNHHP